MNFKHICELNISVDDWHVFLLWSNEPFGHIVQERMEWLEDNLQAKEYELWYKVFTPNLSRHYYLSIKNDEDAIAYKLRWC